jgi:hypothetical protein
MVISRKAAFVAITDSDDDDNTDKVISFCPSCKNYGFNYLLKERIYPKDQPLPSDHENWMQCHTCGTIVSKVHAKRQDVITGIKEPDNNIHDYPGKVVIAVMNKKSIDRRRNFIKNLNKPDHSKGPENSDIDLQQMLSKGKQLVSYTSEE